MNPLSETGFLVLLYVARNTGLLGASGVAKTLAQRGHAKQAEVKRIIEDLLKMRLVTQTRGTPYLCVTVEGVELLRKAGRL